jgi:hypothetical protein
MRFRRRVIVEGKNGISSSRRGKSESKSGERTKRGKRIKRGKARVSMKSESREGNAIVRDEKRLKRRKCDSKRGKWVIQMKKIE